MNIKIASIKKMKATEHFFHVVLFTTSTRLVLLVLILGTKPWCVTIQMKRAIKEYFHVVQ